MSDHERECEHELHRLAQELGLPDDGPQENVDGALSRIRELEGVLANARHALILWTDDPHGDLREQAIEWADRALAPPDSEPRVPDGETIETIRDALCLLEQSAGPFDEACRILRAAARSRRRAKAMSEPISNTTCTRCQRCGEWTNYADDPCHKAREDKIARLEDQLERTQGYEARMADRLAQIERQVRELADWIDAEDKRHHDNWCKGASFYYEGRSDQAEQDARMLRAIIDTEQPDSGEISRLRNRLAQIERQVRELADRIEGGAEPVLEDTECIVDELRVLIDAPDAGKGD